ncbi:MAG: FeoB-associated Cys-rich membrane protein [Tunicatimonas sp.]
MQEIIVILIFAAAVAYLSRLLYRNLTTDAGCPSGCGSCNTVDFKKIEQQIKEREKAG